MSAANGHVAAPPISVESQNLIIEYRSGEGRIERFPGTRGRVGAPKGRRRRDARNAGGACRQKRHRDHTHRYGGDRRGSGDRNGR